MKLKNIFNSICLIFGIIGMFICGLFFININAKKTEADFTDYNSVSNSLPEYLNISGGVATASQKSIILLNSQEGSNAVNISIATDQIKRTIIEKDPTSNENKEVEKINFAYLPNENNTDEYYLFNFTSSLSLYKDITNQDLSSLTEEEKSNNLLKNISISTFATSRKDSFTVEGLSKAPEQLNIKLTLGESISAQSNNSTVTLTEGLYTLVIPMTRYYTYDNGTTYTTDSSDLVQIAYTFMIFNSSTYFNSSTGLQNITMENVEDVTISNNANYSKFYFYNYTTSTLPKFSYNPNIYQITVSYTDYNQITHYQKVEYNGNGSFSIKDENGNIVNDPKVFVNFNEDLAYITFNDLGEYDISFEYLYRIDYQDGTYKIFQLPFNELDTQNSLIQYNKAQRLYVYGYQTMYTNFNEPVDPSTNQYPTRELKSFDENYLNFEKSADITAGFMTSDDSAPKQHSQTPIGIDTDLISTYIQDITPVTTNQVPVKFLSNVTLNSSSTIYKVTTENQTKSITKFDDFTNENQNQAGEYVYVIEYQFDNYMGANGEQQSAYYHYQIFYFKITNETPSVSVLDSDGNSFAITRFTNKSVYIINEATDSPYNADVTINIEMYDYSTERTSEKSLQELQDYDKNTFTYYKSFIGEMDKATGKEVVLINNQSKNANRQYTIRYSSTMTKENSYTFTIDTNEIKLSLPRIAEEFTNGQYNLTSEISSLSDDFLFGTTNSSFAFAWNEKQSKATTYGQVKYIPFKQIDYYKDLNEQIQLLINNLLASQEKVLPVSYKLDFSQSSSWSPVTNTKGQDQVSATNVKTDAGLYIIEVYDIAGNVTFGLFMLDGTEPIFIKKTVSSSTNYEIVNSSCTVAVNDEAEVSINWGDFKAIILQNYSDSDFANIEPYLYAYMVDETTAKDNLTNLFKNFISADNSYIKTLSPSTGSIEEGLTYSNKYIAIEIDDNYAVKETSSDNYVLKNGNSYDIEMPKADLGEEQEVKEGTYQFLLIDASNSLKEGTILDRLKNNPSAKLSVTVSSDSSAVSVKAQKISTAGEISYKNLVIAGFSMTGDYYKDENGNLQKYQSDQYSILTDLSYKFLYYTPTTANNPLKIYYTPLALDGAEIDKLIVSYYPYKISYSDNNSYTAYYDIADTPSNQITIFDSSKDSAIKGEEKSFDLSLGSSNLPLSGRYVITRTYKEGILANVYDYYERIITIDVDPNNLISQIESVSNGDKNWYESVIGGEIVLSMYSGEGQSSLQVSFPFDKDEYKNDSFYNQEWSQGQIGTDVNTISVSGNKLPMMLYIPQYKYTKQAIYNENDNSFSVIENNNLSYYGQGYIQAVKTNGESVTVEGNIDTTQYRSFIVYVENIPIETFTSYEEAKNYLNSTSITQYKIYAEIEYRPTDTSTPIKYKTNGTTNGGYLNFYDENNNPVDALYQAGKYTVTLYQASNQESGSDFVKFYKFKYEITSQQPKVDVYDNSIGTILTGINSTADSSIYEYYTNSNSLKFEWQIPTSEYLAQIDENAISVVYSNSKINNQNISFVLNNQNDTTHNFVVNLTEEQIKAEDAKLTVKMQYEGYDSKYYNQITMNIIFDLIAPTKNLDYLIDNVANSTENYLSSSYLKQNVRENYDHFGNLSNDINNFSYSYTPNSGIFKGYAFTVENSFFETLKSTVINASQDLTSAQEVYYKFIGTADDYFNIFTATTKDSFVATSFTQIDNDFDITDINEIGIYEIVEIDSAGNMVTYLVNYVNGYENDNAVVYQNKNLDEINNKKQYTIENEQIQENENIYSNTGFSLVSLNFQNNPWGIYKVRLSDGTTTWFMASPALQENYIYKIEKPSASETTYNNFAISQMFSSSLISSQQKHTLSFSDGVNGRQIDTFVTIMDATLNLTPVKNAGENKAVLDITIPTSTQIASTTLGHIYPTKVVIEQFTNNTWQNVATALQTEANYGNWSISGTGASLVTFNTTNTTLRITVSTASNTKVKYTITDNFGNISTIIQIANEALFNEIVGGDYYYTITESGNATTYLADQTLTYSYNTQLYNAIISKWDGFAWQNSTPSNESTTNGIRAMTFVGNDKNYNDIYRIELYDIESTTNTPLKTVYLKLYNQLPEYVSNKTLPSNYNYLQMRDKNGEPIEQDQINASVQSINFNGKTFTVRPSNFTTYSQNVTLLFSNGQTTSVTDENFDHNGRINYSVYISKDNGLTWENVNDSYEGLLISGAGKYLIFVKYDSEKYFTNSCKLYSLTILDSSTIYYHITTADGEEVEKSKIYYTNENNKTFEATYIVGIDYNDKNSQLSIEWNEDEELGLTYSNPPTGYSVGDGVYVEEYSYNCTTSSGNFAIIYITPSSKFVSTLNYEDSTGSSTQITGNSINIYASTAETSFEKLKINFKSYYGIEENKVNVIISKYINGSYTEFESPIYKTNDELSYFYLEKAGSYRIRFTDSSTPANVQKFGNNEYLSVTFINEVPFVISYQEESGQVDDNGQPIMTTIVGEKVQKAIYNHPITLSLYNVSTYFQASGYPKISVLKNGKSLSISNPTATSYTFSDPGYYSIKFSATSLSGVNIRESEYNFTIINPNESKYSFSFSNYKNYYVKTVVKDGVDITESLISISNFDTIVVNGKTYLSELLLSYGDEKTGSGRYSITICSNQSQFASILEEDYTFDVWINNATPPISVSIAEGESTSDPIVVTINTQNFYNMIGDSYIVVGRDRYYINSDTLSSYNEVQQFTLTQEGTWYIQVYSASGTLLYTYKVYKTEPLNAFSIIAIIIGIIILIIIIVITIKLRKRQRVK